MTMADFMFRQPIQPILPNNCLEKVMPESDLQIRPVKINMARYPKNFRNQGQLEFYMGQKAWHRRFAKRGVQQV